MSSVAAQVLAVFARLCEAELVSLIAADTSGVRGIDGVGTNVLFTLKRMLQYARINGSHMVRNSDSRIARPFWYRIITRRHKSMQYQGHFRDRAQIGCITAFTWLRERYE